MIVCVCNALSESEIVATAQNSGHGSAEQVYAQLGCQPICGRCLDYADDLIEDSRPSASPICAAGVLAAVSAA